MITIYDSTTAPAVMNAHCERLSDFCPADTCLACSSWINFHDQPTSILRFVGQHVYESRDRDVEHRFAQPAASKPFNVQIFNRNKAVSVNQFSRFLVVKVATLIADMIVEPLQQQNRFSPAVRAAFSSRYASLQTPEIGLCGSEPTRVFDLGAVAQRDEVVNADINADHVWIERQRIRFTVNSEQGKPAAGLALDGQCFGHAFKRTVQPYSHVANLRQSQAFSDQPVSGSAVRDAVIPARRAKARIPGLLSSLYPSKECGEGQVNTFQRLLQNVRVNSRHVIADLLNLGELQILIKPRDRFPLTLPGVAPFLQGCVVKLATHGKLPVERLFLSFGRIDAVAKGLDHES